MKLKPVVASLVVLGLMGPAFAAKGGDMAPSKIQQQIVDQNSVTSPVSADGWFNRISVGGIGSVVGIVGNRDVPGSFITKYGHASDMFVNNANLLVNANLSSWSKATVNLAYLGAPTWDTLVTDDLVSNVRSIDHRVVVDEAYVTIANLAKSPFYAKIGRQYVGFGEYSDPYTPWQVMSPAQMLAQTNATAATVGVSSAWGFYFNAFAFRGEATERSADGNTAGNIKNFGGKIGWYDNLDQFQIADAHININAGYIRSILDSELFNPDGHRVTYGNFALDPIGAISAHLDVAYKPFDLSANWVGTIKNVLEADGSQFGGVNSKFWAADVGATYAFKTMDHDSHVGLGVQWTGNAQPMINSVITSQSFMIPKTRYVGDYKVNVFKNTDLDLIVAHGKSYDLPEVQQDQSVKYDSHTSTVGLARLMFQF